MNEIIASTLENICESTNFPYGETWIPNEKNNLLELNLSYYINYSQKKQQLEQFWLCSQDLILSRGEGLPGRVWSSKQPEWILDVSAESEGYFLRNKIAKAFDIKTGFAVPVMAQDRVLVVLAFFTVKILPENSSILAIAITQTEVLGKLLSNL